MHGHHYFSGARMIAVLAQIHALPGSQGQLAIADRNGKATAQNRAFQMGGHIVGAFAGMEVIGRILRAHLVEM